MGDLWNFLSKEKIWYGFGVSKGHNGYHRRLEHSGARWGQGHQPINYYSSSLERFSDLGQGWQWQWRQLERFKVQGKLSCSLPAAEQPLDRPARCSIFPMKCSHPYPWPLNAHVQSALPRILHTPVSPRPTTRELLGYHAPNLFLNLCIPAALTLILQ